jgi:TRAP-type mannitol/chloroaromatic compound transport system permease small subunit
MQPSGRLSAFVSAIRGIDAAQRRLGHGLAWLVLLIALAQFSVVVLRDVFETGLVWQQVNIRYLNGVFCLMGLGYALLFDAHVRVDVFYRSASMRRKAWIDLAGVALVFLYKSTLWAGAAALFAQGVSLAAKAALFLTGSLVAYPPVFAARLSDGGPAQPFP